MKGNREMKIAPAPKMLTALAASALLALALATTACGHKAAPPPPTPPAPPAAQAPAPTVTLTADPTAIESGSRATLSWTSSNAVRVELNGETVNLNGSQPVNPSQSTDYQIVAHSADGQTANAAVRVTVTEPPPPAQVAPPATNDLGTWDENVRDAFFDYDKSDIRPDAQTALQADAEFLKSHPALSIRVVGHCDERGSAEYNLALGDRRAESVKTYLVSQGVDASRINTVSVGKEQPFCTEQSDNCYQQNRRGHFTQGQQPQQQ
ncbi:MAG: peptidoglycan-associated lipoprotein Pal [Terriglobales bacterium]